MSKYKVMTGLVMGASMLATGAVAQQSGKFSDQDIRRGLDTVHDVMRAVDAAGAEAATAVTRSAAATRPPEAQIMEQVFKPGVIKDEPGCVREYDSVETKIPMTGPDGKKTFISISPSRCKGDTTIKFKGKAFTADHK